MKTTLILFALLLFGLSIVHAQDGALDLTFNSTGIVTTSFGTKYDFGKSVAIQTDGKIVVAGNSDNGNYYDFAVIRYNSDGTLDTGFGTGGKVTTSVGSFSDDAYGVAIQSDGKIVVAGSTSNGNNNDVAVVRYNNDGTLDATFGSVGKVITVTSSNYDDTAYGVAIQSDGKIVVAGYTRLDGSSGIYDFLIIRYNTNGTLDTSFDADGIVTTDFSTANEIGYSIVIQSDGKIVVGGYSGTNKDFAVARYNTNGTLDTGFGTGGKITTAIGLGDDVGKSIAIQSDGKILLGGYARIGSTDDFALVRYNSDGSLDTGFGSGGKVTTAVSTGTDWGSSIALQSDGKILLAGFATIGINTIAIVRYNIDGSIDNTFDSDGMVTTSIGSIGATGSSIALQSDGKIVVAGSSYVNQSNSDFTVVRYSNSIALTGSICGMKFNDLDGDGAKDSNEPGLANWEISIKNDNAPGSIAAITDVNGQFCFNDLAAGTYRVSEYSQNGWTQTYPDGLGTHSITLAAGENKVDVHFGNKEDQTEQTDACITWELLSNDAVTYTSGNITGQAETIQGMSLFSNEPYSANGQQLWMPITGWVASSTEIATQYIEFNASPATGNIFTVTNVSFYYGDYPLTTDFNILQAQVYYSTDSWTSPGTLLNTSPLLYLNTGMQSFLANGLSVLVGNGQTFSLRIYPYSPTGGIAMARTFAVHNNVVICGSTEPVDLTLGSICGIKFNDLNGDGVKDQGEPGLANWVINLSYDTAAGTVNLTDSTDENGNYCFNDLQPGITYTISEINQTGWSQTFPDSPGNYTVTLTSGQQIGMLNFGNKLSPIVGCVAPPNGMVGWWPGDGNTNDIQSGNHGMLQNGATFAVGKVDQALSFDGVNDRVDIPDAPNLRLQEFTIDAWVKLDENRLEGIVCKQFGNGSLNSYALDVENGKLLGVITDGTSNHFITSEVAVPVGQYVFTAMTWDGLTMRLYINGDLVKDQALGAITIPYDNNPITLGADDNGQNAIGIFLSGLIDEVEIFNRALSILEIKSIYNAGSAGKCKPGSLCGMKFNDLNGNGLVDQGETGLADWVINLSYEQAAGTTTLTDTTDANGNYCFNDLQPGITYTISEINQTGWSQTFPDSPGTHTVTLPSGQQIKTLNFGNHFIGSTDSCIYLCNSDFEQFVNIAGPTGYVQTNQDNIPCWNTMASDGKIEIWHGGYGTVPAYSGNFFAELNATQVGTLYQTFSATTVPQSVIASFAHRGRYSGNDVMNVSIVAPDGTSTLLGTYTDNNTAWGYYSVPFTILAPGSYSLKFASVSSNNGNGPADGGNFLDAINVTCPSSVCGIKFNDLNGDGQKQADEPGLSNWEITLSGSLNLTTQTGSDGSYCFNNLTAGTYTVSETQQAGWDQTYPAAPGTHTVTLETEQSIDTLNFGNQLLPVGSICDSLRAEVSGSAIADCCWSISLTQPSNTSGITGIQFESLLPNSFVSGSSQLGSSYTGGWLYVENSASKFTIRRLSGNIPSGQLNNFFNFCLNKLTNPQVVVVNWLNASDSIVCSDTVTVDCDIPCVSIIDADVLCDNSNYALNYAFTNNAGFTINKIEVEQITPSGITISPALVNIPLVISGGTSAMQTFTVIGAAPNTTVTIVFKFTSADGCCSCTETISVTTPSCMCEEIDARLEQDPVNCCATLSLTNNYSGSYFTQINLTALTTGTTFSTWNTNTTAGWYSLNTFASNTVNLVNIGNGFVPSGNSNGILNFCLAGFASTPQQILVEWIRNDSVQCVDTLITTCTPTAVTGECVQLVDDSLICLPDGSFGYKFKVRNNSSHTTTGFQLNPVSPAGAAFAPFNFSSISIAPGMTSAEQTITISGVNSNELFCFEIALYEHIYRNDKLQYSWCCHSEIICIETPDCAPTGCVDPPSGMVGWWPGDGNTDDISGLNNHGTITGDVVYLAGKVDQTFNINNYGVITVPNHPSLNFGTGNLTIDAWVKTTDSLHSFNITQKAYANLIPNGFYIVGYDLLISAGKLRFFMGDGYNILNSHDTNVQIADGDWHYVAVTVDRTSTTGGKLYVDGNIVLTFDPTTVPGSISNNEPLILFNESNYYDETGNQIDELEIFNRALSETEIKSIFNAGSEGKCKESEELGSICGMKYNDLNDNGRRDDGEPGIPNWTITLDGTAEISTTTDREGNFCFVNLPAGEYKINELMQNSWIQTSPFTGYYAVNLAEGQNITGVYFGNKVEKEEKPGSICGMKFNDLNGNGQKDDNEPGLGNWTITLDGTVEMTITTDKDGSFCFVDLPAGEYKINEMMQEGWVQTLPSTGFHGINLAAGQNITGIDFGNRIEKDDRLGSICGMKFNDLNGNGRKDENEPGLPEWKIVIDGTIETSTITDKEGNFCFINLPAGEYKINEVMQTGWVQTLPSTGYYVVNLASGQNITGIDFGNRVDKDDKLGSICGMKFNDLNGNGVKDKDEPGIADWRIYLDGATSMSTTTDRDGNFCFTRLPAGEYRISEGMLNGWVQTAPASGYFVVDLSAGQNISDLYFGNKQRIVIISPDDQSFIKQTDRPTFVWLSPVPFPTGATGFHLKIVEIIGNQSPEEAILLNETWFESGSIKELVFQYPSSAPNFNFGQQYACQIRLNGENPIESGIIVIIVNLEGWPSAIKLVSPGDGEIIGPDSITFKWAIGDVISDLGDIISLSYKIKIVEIIGDQSPEEAMLQIDSFFDIFIELSEQNGEVKFEYPEAGPRFESDKKYAWQISHSPIGQPSIQSEVWEFTYGSTVNTNGCEDFNFELRKIYTGDSVTYACILTNKYTGTELANVPKSFSIEIRNNLVIGIDDYAPKEWNRTPSKFPPGSSQIKWTNNSGDIPNGESNLGAIHFGVPTTNPFYVVYNWINVDGKVICKDSIALTETIKLIAPADGASIREGSVLVFSWEPVDPTPSSYKIKIVEIIGDQSPEDAMREIDSFFDIFIELSEQNGEVKYEFPESGPRFESGKKYAWQIGFQVGDLETEALSEIWMFTFQDVLVSVKLQQPPANQLKAEDLWIASLDNTTGKSLEVYLLGSLSEAKQGNVFETKSGLKTLKPGTTMVYSTDFDAEMVLTIFDRWGNLIFGSGDYTICLRVEDQSGEELGSGCIDQKVEIKTSVEGIIQTDHFQLLQSYPNPFTNTTTIGYYIPNTSFITISVYNIYGKEIEVLVKEEKMQGQYEVIFDGKNLTSGIYFYTLSTDGFIQSKKMTRMK